MLWNQLGEYLIKINQSTKFKTNIGNSLGYIEFSNTGKDENFKLFTLSLGAIKSALNDILINIDEFQDKSTYDEKPWRSLEAHFSDANVRNMIKVQTKPFFTTLSKVINWANGNDKISDDLINLEKDAIILTIKKLDEIIENFTPFKNEKKYSINLNNSRLIVDETSRRDFVKKVFEYFISTGKIQKLMPFFENLNSKTYPQNINLVVDGIRLTTIFKISDVQLDIELLKQGGTLRYFEEPFTIDSKLFYLRTEWTYDTAASQLDVKNLGDIISKVFPYLTLEFNEASFSLRQVDFEYKNILFKGVPGTGKSFTIDKIIAEQLNLEKDSKNVLRINIHSASSNSDLMQGIGISSKDGAVEYKEKQGLIYNHIKSAILNPYQPFSLILEEIQENSLNELIGDLIYLIEDSKRLQIDKIIDMYKNNFESEFTYQELIDKLISFDGDKHFVELPYLIEDRTDYRKMVLPNNLYVFCTSNYRDDKKIIEDNLLRRFEVIEIYPSYKESIYKNNNVAKFLEKLNIEIIKHFKDMEIHPDRLIFGHANWQKVNNKKDFYRALLKVIIEFKDIKDIAFTDVMTILKRLTDSSSDLNVEFETILSVQDYKQLIEIIQEKSAYDFL